MKELKDERKYIRNKTPWRIALAVSLSFFLFHFSSLYGEVVFSGGIQHDGLFPTVDVRDIRANERGKWAKIDHLSNNYLDLALTYFHRDSNAIGFTGVRVDARGELTQWPLPGYESDFGGWGLSRLSAKTDFTWGHITLGDVYGQFGSGLILSLYEDRALGVDNSLRGAKIELSPYRGIGMMLIGGKQRRYWSCYEDHAWGWNYTRDAAMGADLELSIDQWSTAMQDKGIGLSLGGSYVSKYEAEDSILTIREGEIYMYRLPRWIGAGDLRANLQVRGVDILLEYAYKANDPTADNQYSYAHGDAFLASVSYSQKGLSVLAQIKRSENMSFRSERQRRGIAGRLNHMPAFAQQHTYTLAALYPYATQYASGEWAFQAEVRNTWRRKTPMGGRYGTSLKIGGSHIRGLKTPGSWEVSYGKDGEYYTDVNIELNKRITSRWWLNAMAMYQTYNQRIVEGEGEIIRSGIFVLDTKVAVTDNISMRGEAQYLCTRQHQGQWVFLLYELSLWNRLTISGQWLYNIGGTPDATHEHYYTAAVTYTHGAHRLMAGYTKTREGYNCSGGVCRYVPRQEGVSMSYNFNW